MSKQPYKLFFSVLTLCYSIGIQAAHIVVEPDNYLIGADLSKVSPFVSIQGVCGGPLYAQAASLLPAPTGNLTFGRAGFGFGGCPQNGEADLNSMSTYSGLGFVFGQATSHVRLLAKNDYESYSFISAEWAAFDKDGKRIGGGQKSGNYGETFAIDIDVPNLWSFKIGGHDTIPVLSFDRLSFDVAEPNAFSLSMLALLACGICARWRSLPQKACVGMRLESQFAMLKILHI